MNPYKEALAELVRLRKQYVMCETLDFDDLHREEIEKAWQEAERLLSAPPVQVSEDDDEDDGFIGWVNKHSFFSKESEEDNIREAGEVADWIGVYTRPVSPPQVGKEWPSEKDPGLT